jgi:hypothetical protein
MVWIGDVICKVSSKELVYDAHEMAHEKTQ